jgi:hypothetical protein
MRRRAKVLLAGVFVVGALGGPLAGMGYAKPTALPGANDQPGNSDCHGHSSDVPPGLYKNNCT